MQPCVRRRHAAVAVEYCLIAALIAVAAGTMMLSVGHELSSFMYNLAADIAGTPQKEPDPPLP